MCENCFLTIEMKNRQHKDMQRIREREAGHTCSNCSEHVDSDDFYDCLCVCLRDGLEKGKNSRCKSWSE